MELIMPAEISGKIMTIIDSAKEKIIIISPYVKMVNWPKLTSRIIRAKENGVKIDWYIRKNESASFQEVSRLGIRPNEIENLHCKLYMNEKSAVVTSMNLYEYSDSNSLDIGYFTNNEKNITELMGFVSTYIQTIQNQNTKPIALYKDYQAEKKPSNNLFDWLTVTYPKYRNRIFLYTNKYGNCLGIKNFKNHYILNFEMKGSYFRVDLNIDNSHPMGKWAGYKALCPLEEILQEKTGQKISFGSQVKCLKIDIGDFENYDYKTWSADELNKNIPILSRIIDAYEALLI